MAAEDEEATVEASLLELNPESCGFGEWTLKVQGAPRVITYEYQWNGKQREGRRMECTLASRDASVYCTGTARRAGGQQGSALFDKVLSEIKEGRVFVFHKITLAKEKTMYVSAPVKFVIDLVKTPRKPVLQSIVAEFPRGVAPATDLAVSYTHLTLPTICSV